jgi:hypothetical protein
MRKRAPKGQRPVLRREALRELTRQDLRTAAAGYTQPSGTCSN